MIVVCETKVSRDVGNVSNVLDVGVDILDLE